MPNVDMNERYVINSMLPEADREHYAACIERLPTPNKAVLFRNLNANQILGVLNDLYSALCQDGDTSFTSNSNNQMGRDLTGEQTGQEFEIKIGTPTTAALGIKTMGLFLSPEIVTALPAREGINRRKKLIASAASHPNIELGALIEQVTHECHQDLRRELEHTLSTVDQAEEPFAPWGRQALNLLVSGATHAKVIRRGLNAGAAEMTPYTVLQLTRHTDGVPRWSRSTVPELTDHQGWTLEAVLSDKGRLTFYCQTEGVMVKFVHNQKNSAKLNVNGETVRLGYATGTNTFSFNVWVTLL